MYDPEVEKKKKKKEKAFVHVDFDITLLSHARVQTKVVSFMIKTHKTRTQVFYN